MLRAVTPADLRAVLASILAAAMRGDMAAARLVLEYTVGKPARAVEMDCTAYALRPVQPIDIRRDRGDPPIGETLRAELSRLAADGDGTARNPQ